MRKRAISKVELAREIAARSPARFVEIEPEKRVRRYTAYQKLLDRDPEVAVRRAAALALKEEQSRKERRT